jgi:Fic family protein
MHRTVPAAQFLSPERGSAPARPLIGLTLRLPHLSPLPREPDPLHTATHPVLDGNGRVGRLLITFLLYEQQALQKPVLYLSYYFKRHRQQYYELLQAVRDQGAWEAWLAFFLRGVAEISKQATETARRILMLREDHRRAITERLGRTAAKGYRVLEHLYEHPIVSVNEVHELIGGTYQSANELISRFVDTGILTEVTGQTRNRKFKYSSYINLFHDDQAEVAR